MAIMIIRPTSGKVAISATPSPPCISCANCKGIGAQDIKTGKRTGMCHSPDNLQDAKGTVPEPIGDIEDTHGSCKSFIHRTTRGVGLVA